MVGWSPMPRPAAGKNRPAALLVRARQQFSEAGRHLSAIGRRKPADPPQDQAIVQREQFHSDYARHLETGGGVIQHYLLTRRMSLR